MIELNENAIEYARKLGFNDFVLDVIKFTS